MLALSSCGLLPPPAYLGHVAGPGGVPLPGVVISSADGSDLSDDSGSWALSTRASTLTFRKPGYKTLQVPARSSDVTLQQATTPLQVVFDDRWEELPSSGLQGWLVRQGPRVYDLTAGQEPATADVVVMLSPAYLANWAITPALTAVREGRTLLLAGQWGGYAGTDLGTLNALAAGTGIRFEGSLVRDRAATDDPDAFVPKIIDPAIAADGSPIFYSAGALTVASPARVLLESGVRSYRVSAWSDGPQIVGAVAALGAGKIVALSDAACFSNLPEGPAKIPGWQASGNAQLALGLIHF